jgi:hypothetical protein
MTVLRNMGAGIRACERLFTLGYAPFCPWADHVYEFIADHPKRCYYEASLSWLRVADAMLVIGDHKKSEGTQREIEIAKIEGVPIFYDIDDLHVAIGPMRPLRSADDPK